MEEKRVERRIKRMEKLQRFRNKFSDKQVHTITAILSLIWIVRMIFVPIEIMYRVVLMLVGPTVIWLLIEFFIFDMDERESEKEEKELSNTLPEKFHLKKNEFVEVLLSPYTDGIPGQAMKEAVEDLRELGVKYYAKINEDHTEITLIKKDKNENEIGKPQKISNFRYFNSNYKPKE